MARVAPGAVAAVANYGTKIGAHVAVSKRRGVTIVKPRNGSFLEPRYSVSEGFHHRGGRAVF